MIDFRFAFFLSSAMNRTQFFNTFFSPVIIIVIIIVIVHVHTASAQVTPIKCSAGTFSKCQSASVTCYFGENIRKTRKNFNIVQYPFNRRSSNSDSG
jgi:hypothetical protein